MIDGELVSQLVLSDSQFPAYDPITRLDPQKRLAKANQLPCRKVVQFNMAPFMSQTLL